MSESGDYDPGAWKGYDFDDARKTYDKSTGRSYADAVNTGKEAADLVPANLTTYSSAPVVVVCDVTGSMGEWPATIFSKLPYFELEGQEYLGKDMEVSFAAVGDAYCDRYPFQGRKFTKGTDLKTQLDALVRESGGGTGITESYELAALYYALNCSMPKAIRKPIIFFIGDEVPYDTVPEDIAKKFAKISKPKKYTTTKEIFEALKAKFSVYLIRKPYGNGSAERNGMDPTNKQVHNKWAELIGDDRIYILPEAQRVVDVMFGIMARETNREGYFEKEITERQDKEQVKTVFKSLKDAKKAKSAKDDTKSKKDAGGKSVLRGSDPGKKKTGRLV